MRKRAGITVGLAGPAYEANTAVEHQQAVVVGLNWLRFDFAGTFNTTLDEIFADKSLSPAGQRGRIKEALTATLPALEKFEAQTKKTYTDPAAAIEKALRAKVVPPKDVAPELLREIRESMRDMTPEERITIFRTTDDPHVRAAIVYAPPALGSFREGDKTRRFEAFVDPDELSAAQLELARAADPAAAQKMDDLRNVAEVFKLAVGSVRREMEDIVAHETRPV